MKFCIIDVPRFTLSRGTNSNIRVCIVDLLVILFMLGTQAAVQQYFQKLLHLLNEEYSIEDRQIVGCPSLEQVSEKLGEICSLEEIPLQAANLAGFRASEDPRFEAGIPDFMNGILNFSIHFNVVHRKVDWRNPKMKSLNSMPALDYLILFSLFHGGMIPGVCFTNSDRPSDRVTDRICPKQIGPSVVGQSVAFIL